MTIKKLIFFLNNALPDENASIWVKAEEIHERLIHAGVSRSLPLHLVQEALQRNNKDDVHVKPWEYGGSNYFRPQRIHMNDISNTGPFDQRFKRKGAMNRLNINPIRDYFKKDGNTISQIVAINEALDKYEEQLALEREKEKSKFSSCFIISFFQCHLS